MGTDLLSLPAELLCAIADEVSDPQDLKALRSACRQLSAATSLKTFRNAFFTRRNVLFTRVGLERLVDITSQPHLIANLAHIGFLTVDVGIQEVKSSLLNRIEDVKKRDGVDVDDFLAISDPPLSIKATKELESIYAERELRFAQYSSCKKRFNKEEDDMAKNDLDVELLTKIIDNIAATGATPTFRINSEFDSDPKLQCGFEASCATLGPESEIYLRPKWNDTRAAAAINTASARAKHPLQGINMLCRALDGVGPPLVSSADSELEELAWSQLSILRIGISATYVGGNEYAMQWSGTEEAWVRMLRSATQLRGLSINLMIRGLHPGPAAGPPHNSQGLIFLQDNIISPQLSTLEISLYKGPVAPLMTFLKNHRASLKQLMLTFTILFGQACSSQFLSCLAELDLVYVRLCKVVIDETQRVLCDKNGNTDVIIEGEGVSRSLEEFRDLCTQVDW